MGEQLYFEDVEIGMPVPPLTKQLSSRQFVQWAGADHDWNPLHYDHFFATQRGLSGIVGPGALTTAFLGQLLTDWIGPRGQVRQVRGEYRGVTYPTDVLTVTGKVIAKRIAAEGNLVECELWCENPGGKRVTIGGGLVALPTKAG